eukprot:3429292-Prymnesium_polylepis.1
MPQQHGSCILASVRAGGGFCVGAAPVRISTRLRERGGFALAGNVGMLMTVSVSPRDRILDAACDETLGA